MNLRSEVHRLSFYTQYNQFYFLDPKSDDETDNPLDWSDEAHSRGLAVGRGILGIGTISYGNIRCFLEISEKEPQLSHSPWQRIVEASITLSTGKYKIIDCPTSVAAIEGNCPPGDYRLRVYGAFLDSEVESGNGDDYFDFYWLVLWPEEFSEPKVLKHCQIP